MIHTNHVVETSTLLAVHRVSVYELPVDWWLVGFFSFGPDIFHPWVNGYGDY